MLLLTMACAAGCGLSPYGTILIVGLGMRFQETFAPVGGLLVLKSTPILVLAGILFALEFIVEKVPRWDLRWHLKHGWIRIGIAVVLTWMSSGAFPIDVRILVVLLGAICTFGIHAARTGAHIAMHGAGTAPFAVPLSGVVENCLLVAVVTPVVTGRLGVCVMMLGIIALSAALTLVLTWGDARRVIWDMLLGPAPKSA